MYRFKSCHAHQIFFRLFLVEVSQFLHGVISRSHPAKIFSVPITKIDSPGDWIAITPVMRRVAGPGLTPTADVSSISLLQPKLFCLPAEQCGGPKVRIENPDGANGNANHCQGHF